MPGSIDMMTAHKMVKFRHEPQDPAGKVRPRGAPRSGAPRSSNPDPATATIGPTLCSLTFPHQQSTPLPSSNMGTISALFLRYFCAFFEDLFEATLCINHLRSRTALSGFGVPRRVDLLSLLPCASSSSSADCHSSLPPPSTHAGEQGSRDHRESNSNQGSLKVGSRFSKGSIKVKTPAIKVDQG